ncbi:hypothetical protein O181_128410 [Austropuccinia psidii MF-1]|uniref:Uncharacterized protein n=1 Tax=Austropuccinia psidii MF-1 TaxID=1389203 RepID=A0A9Q3Q8Z7_9BASI|nr:hypothetical protein [Austropuccinia psidii MF-1]
MVTQNNQPEPISSELINLDISNTLQKAKNLANNQEQAITPQAAPEKVIDVIMAKANQLQKNKELTPPNEASVDIYKASQKAYNNSLQHKEYQILLDLWKNCINSYLTVRKLLGHPNTCKLLNGWHPLMEKKKMMLLTAEWRITNPPPPKQVPKTASVASISNSNVKKQPQDQKKGKGKAPATNPYRQGYRIPKIQQDAMENLFKMARTMMELQKKEEARLKYQK